MTQDPVMVERDEALENAVVGLLNVAVVLDAGKLRCALCGQTNKHLDACPIRALEQWINPFN